jgi:hypothetical protein
MPHSIFRPLAAALAIAALGACRAKTAVVAEAPGAVTLAPVCTEGVIIYESGDQIPGDYRQVAWLETEGNAVWTRDSEMKRSMQEKAGRLGANAIVVGNFTSTKSSVKLIGAALGGTENANVKGSAMAIYVPSEAARSNAACAGR